MSAAMRRLIPLLVFLAACGTHSGQRPANVAKPDIDVSQASPIFFNSRNNSPLSLAVRIRNNATMPLRVREVEVRASGMMQYSLQRRVKLFNETIPPNDERVLYVETTAYQNSNTRIQGSEPLAVQTLVRFEVEGRGFREILLHEVVGPGT